MPPHKLGGSPPDPGHHVDEEIQDFSGTFRITQQKHSIQIRLTKEFNSNKYPQKKKLILSDTTYAVEMSDSTITVGKLFDIEKNGQEIHKSCVAENLRYSSPARSDKATFYCP